jgi:hypothetical protein
MATQTSQKKVAQLIQYYLQPVKLTAVPPFNVGLKSAKEDTMKQLLGTPDLPLTTDDHPKKASAIVKKLARTENISLHVIANGIIPSVQSLKIVLAKAFADELAAGRDLKAVLSSPYEMLNVRYRKPTSGKPSTSISNHAWGTAIDLTILGHKFLGNTHDEIPQFINLLLPIFNKEGWYSGIDFKDTMHFEVSDGTIHDWAKAGKFNI